MTARVRTEYLQEMGWSGVDSVPSSGRTAGTVSSCNCKPRQTQSRLDRYFRPMFDRERDCAIFKGFKERPPSLTGGQVSHLQTQPAFLLRSRAEPSEDSNSAIISVFDCLRKSHSHHHHCEQAQNRTDVLQYGRHDGGGGHPH